MATTPERGRSTYHHGDLRAALLREALEVARAGGPTAITLRSVTRRAGVTVNAAYRHFADRDDLARAVTFHGQAECARLIERRLAGLTSHSGRDRLRQVGIGYVEFARAEPGLFQAAFLEPVDLELANDPRAAGESGRTPFQLLSDALDAMQDDGDLSAEKRVLAEVPCWSAVHGLAMLVVQGPLRSVGASDVDALTQRVVEGAIVAVTQV
ncbi:TetR/AcrR family transcriptional regulator [Mobilicoccus massiliensis]|uniref:TetR/AcrR family transcriptional regulator n=1 Tax=Mobilicoccus massiliensis TaxID=1522310 RepID=UPI0005917F77|nr:TetR/AcrR family transcriptional regulator [Mobilicoccus massiliensis]